MGDSVVSFAVERIGEFIIKEAAFLKGLSEQVEEMQIELEWMECFLTDADKRKDESLRVRNWVCEIRNLIHHSEDVIERFAIKTALRRERGGAFSFIARYVCFHRKVMELHKVGSKMEAIKSRLSTLRTRLQIYGVKELRIAETSSSAQRRGQRRSWSPDFVGHDYVVGFDNAAELLVERLVKEEYEHGFVFISGMGGLGKTTLANKVYKDKAVRDHFEAFVWVTVSQQFQEREIWERILLDLQKIKDKKDLKALRAMRDYQLAEELRKVQMQKKCLVILDDVWSVRDWRRLCEAFCTQRTESKIMVTTRNKEVVVSTGPGTFHHELQFLQETDCVGLLKKIAIPPNEAENRDKIKLCEEMVRHCKGLPLAVVVVGGILATRETLGEWYTVQENIKSYLWRGKGHEEELDGGVPGVLALSYKDLPYHLKLCFIYLANFPEDHEIPRMKLILMWMAEGFISTQRQQQQGREGEETMEDVGERYFSELVDRCMILVGNKSHTGRIKSCRLHDLMRDVCLSKAKEENYVFEVNSAGGAGIPLAAGGRNSQVRSLIMTLDNSKLKSYFVFKSLRCLELSYFNELFIPRDIGHLYHLRYLRLDSGLGYAAVLPSSIGNLRLLQTLDLRIHDGIIRRFAVSRLDHEVREIMRSRNKLRLPNVIWKMESLRHLYLPFYGVDKSCELQLSNLDNLQTLVNPPNMKGGMKELVSLMNLRKLKLNRRDYVQEFGEILKTGGSSSIFRHLRSLSLDFDSGNFSNPQVDLELIVSCFPRLCDLLVKGQIINSRLPDQFPRNLTKLTLSESKLEDPQVLMETLGKLPNLKLLNLRTDCFTGRKIVCCKDSFPKLRSLVLSSIHQLEEWTVEEGAMPCLSHLDIGDCKSLKTLPDGLKFITTLRELEIIHMDSSFRDRLKKGGEDYYKIQHVPRVQQFLY